MQITEIPSWLAGAWSISEAVAQVILSITVILMVLLPIMYLAKGRSGAITIYLLVFFLTECFLAGVGWMPFWILIATVAVMSMSVAYLGRKAVAGG